MVLSENRFSGTIDFGNLPKNMLSFNVRTNALSGTVQVSEQVYRMFEANLGVCLFDVAAKLIRLMYANGRG